MMLCEIHNFFTINDSLAFVVIAWLNAYTKMFDCLRNSKDTKVW